MVSALVNAVQVRAGQGEPKSRFAPVFWVANSLELVERLAFYSSQAILAVYLAEKVGLGSRGNELAGLFSMVLYSLPILAGTLVDRYGFRRCLLTCFGMFTL